VINLFGLVILTKKEVVQLAKEERSLGYGAGLKSKWRAKKKTLEWQNGTPDNKAIPLPVEEEERLRKEIAESIFTTPPSVYGDSLPVKDVPEVTVHIGDVGPVETGTVTDNLHYT
jgi:hypothetical protein